MCEMILGRKETDFLQQQEHAKGIRVRMAYREEWDDAMALAWRTFMQFDAKDYSKQGIESFQDFVTDTVLHRMFEMGAYQLLVAVNEEEKIVGIISLRNETHISLLFVDSKYHMQGVGRKLIESLCDYVVSEEGYRRITVNAAPYAVGFYHKLGFHDIGKQEMKDGIIFTPMEKLIGWR